MKNLCMRLGKIRTTTEREVGTKEYVIFQEATITNDNQQQQPFLKVTKSLYIVTILGKLPFMLFT